MACDAFDAFKTATENLSPEIYRNASWQSIWLNLIKRETYPMGIGTTRTTFTVANVEPTSEDEDWGPIVVTGQNGAPTAGACDATFNARSVGFNERTYVPEDFNLRGPIICKDDLTFDHQVDKFLRAYMEELTKRSQRSWENRYESIYSQYARKVVLTSAMTITDTVGKPWTGSTGLLSGTSVVALAKPTSVLTQEHLDVLAVELIDAGATNPDSTGWITLGESGPEFSMLVGINESAAIAKNNSEFRNDIRYGMPSELLKRLGAGRVIKNFRHIPSLRPPRFAYGGTLTVTTVTTAGNTSINGVSVLTASILSAVTNNGITIGDVALAAFSGGIGPAITGAGIPAGSYIGYYDGGATTAGKFVIVDATGTPVAATAAATITATVGTAGQYYRIPRNIESAATRGKQYPVNPAYRVAPIQATYILSPRVFVSEVVKPMNSAGGVSFDPTSYMGDWQWVTGAVNINPDCAVGSDPLNTRGAHFAQMKHAPRPEFPLHGMIIFHLRCAPTVANVTCG